LAFKGVTAIEYWSQDAQKKMKEEKIEDPRPMLCDFRRKDKWENIEYIFGTKSWKLILPSYGPLPHDGVNWEDYINREEF
jgi:hypothetical protein